MGGSAEKHPHPALRSCSGAALKLFHQGLIVRFCSLPSKPFMTWSQNVYVNCCPCTSQAGRNLLTAPTSHLKTKGTQQMFTWACWLWNDLPGELWCTIPTSSSFTYEDVILLKSLLIIFLFNFIPNYCVILYFNLVIALSLALLI